MISIISAKNLLIASPLSDVLYVVLSFILKATLGKHYQSYQWYI